MDKIDDLLANNISVLAEKIKNQHVSPVKLVRGLLDRINQVDGKLNSFITVNSKGALETAKELEHELELGKYRGPLHGVPIGVKDIIDTKNIRTTMGSKIYENYVPEENAPVVKRLIRAGAIIIGKLNTHEFAYGPTGDRSYFGPVGNPYDPTKMAGGSSSGSAASVAACLCYGALGTDTGGSIRTPSSFCGIVGMKPTYGTVSKRGVHPLSWRLDHVGPMTRSILDNAILLNAIAAYDEEDPDSIYGKNEDYTRFIGESINHIKIGIPQQFYYDHLLEEIEKAIQGVITCFESLGAKIVPIHMPDMEKFSEAHKVIIRSDAYAVHEQNLSDYTNDYWDDEVKERLLTGLNIKGFDYSRAIRIQQLSKKNFRQALEDVDVLLTPTMSIFPPKIHERQEGIDKSDENHIRWKITKLTSPTNLSGFPSLTLPCGFSSEGMPIGVQLIGRELDEAKLYQIGYALEQKLALNLSKLKI